jgi:chorismate lyase/3-hydroxybenzoate synthase
VKSTTIPQAMMTGPQMSKTPVRLSVDYVELAKLPLALAETGTYPMAIVSFGHALSGTFPCPVIVLDLPQIDGSPVAEVWTCDRPVRIQENSGCSIAMNGDFLIGSISLNENANTALDATAYEAYRTMLHRIHDAGYPYLWRVWNYFPRINDEQDKLERYRRFCVGRYHALTETLADFPSSLPAATAVGTISGPLRIMFLAGTQPATHLGNPRQLNAYEYPQDYGPRSPSFARASLAQFEHECLLSIAGTASIVGHASRHAGLPREQTNETIQNIQAVLDHTTHAAGFDLIGAQRQAIYKVYVRDSGSLSDIRGAIRRSSLSRERILFLQGDLCRKELLVEIEGLIISN